MIHHSMLVVKLFQQPNNLYRRAYFYCSASIYYSVFHFLLSSVAFKLCFHIFVDIVVFVHTTFVHFSYTLASAIDLFLQLNWKLINLLRTHINMQTFVQVRHCVYATSSVRACACMPLRIHNTSGVLWEVCM